MCSISADNVDTRTVLDVIRKLVTNCNAYMSEDKCLNTRLLWNIAEYITEMFIVFGVIPSSYDSIGFPIVDGILDAVVRYLSLYKIQYRLYII